MLSNIASASDEVKDRNDGFDFFTVLLKIYSIEVLCIYIIFLSC